jgi:trigger factor
MPLHIPLEIESGVKIDEKRDASYDSRIEVLPEIGEIAWKDVELEPKQEVTDDDILERLRMIAARKAPLVTSPDDHEIGEYDQVVLEGKATWDDSDQTDDVTDFRIDLAPWTQPPPGLVDQLMGKKKGHAGETSLVLPRKSEKDMAQRFAKLEYTVSQVVSRSVPAIDEELAKDFDMESLDELKGEIREVIEKEILDDYITKNGNSILDQLVEKSSFDLPTSYRAISEMGQKKKGEDEDEDEDKTKQREEMVKALDKMMRRNLLTMIISHNNGLKLPEETLNQASGRMRDYIDSQQGSQKEKDEVYDKWRQDFEQNLFGHVLSSFLVQEVEKAHGIEPKPQTEPPADNGENPVSDEPEEEV